MPTRQSALIELEVPLRQSGVAGHLDSWFQEFPFRTHINLRGDSTDVAFSTALASLIGMTLPLSPNTVSESGGWRVCWLGPDEWLLLGPDQPALIDSLAAALASTHHSLVMLSGGQTLVRIGGPAWRDVIASACPLDLHPRVFGAGQCAQTVLAHTNVLLIALEDSEHGGALDIVVRRSFADYLLRWLMDAAREPGFTLFEPAL